MFVLAVAPPLAGAQFMDIVMGKLQATLKPQPLVHSASLPFNKPILCLFCHQCTEKTCLNLKDFAHFFFLVPTQRDYLPNRHTDNIKADRDSNTLKDNSTFMGKKYSIYNCDTSHIVI